MHNTQDYLVYKGLQTGYWDWDMLGASPFDNPGLMKELGYHDNELNSTPAWLGKIPEEELECFDERIRMHIESRAEIPFAQEVRFIYRHSIIQYYLFTGRIVKWDELGQPNLMIGSYVNITHQKETEKELARVKDFLNKTNQAAMIGAWEIDMETQKVTWTMVTKRIFGVSSDFVPQRDNFIHFFKEGEDRTKLKEAFAMAVNEGKPYDLELKVINNRGEEIWTRTIGQPEFEKGCCKRVYGIFQDINIQKRTEEKLRMKQSQLESFITSAPAALAMLDRSFNYIAASKIWMASYNIDVTKIIGRNHLDIFHEISDEWKDYMRRCLNGESFKMEEDQFVRRDGKLEWLRWEIKPWYEAPGQVGGILLFTDLITEKKRVKEELVKAKEEAEQALQTKSRFLSVMSHEIRTPMNAVIGFSNLLLQNPREDQQEYLQLLKFSADNLMVIINDILSLSKIEEGMVQLEHVDFNINQLFKNIYATSKPLIGEKNIALKLNFDPMLPTFIKGDSVRLGQVITNLVNNAIKFTQDGEVSINVKLAGTETGRVKVNFEVKDTGIGIPEDKQEYIFEVFTQASSATTRKFGGVGLGLAICRKLVELMGGDILLKSKPGEGSSFSFTVVLEKGPSLKSEPSRIDARKTSGAIKGIKLLLAEDNQINVLIVMRYLDQWGVVCDVAENGQVAVNMAQNNVYDLVLMDLQMPVMDGYEATRQIRQITGGNYATIPVVAITASLVGDIQQVILDSGMNDWISKPFVPDELFEKIRQYTLKK